MSETLMRALTQTINIMNKKTKIILSALVIVIAIAAIGYVTLTQKYGDSFISPKTNVGTINAGVDSNN